MNIINIQVIKPKKNHKSKIESYFAKYIKLQYAIITNMENKILHYVFLYIYFLIKL